jgi:hypothetical protein
LAQSSIAWAIDSIANPHLNNDLGAIIAFPGETFGLTGRRDRESDLLAIFNRHDSYAHLKDVLTRLPTQKACVIGELLPQSRKPAETFKV